jgi:hypothetical protein
VTKKTPIDLVHLREGWIRFKNWKRFLNTIPDRNPFLKPSVRPVGTSGIFSYRLTGVNYESLSERFYKDRNKTFKRKFVEYLSQVYSELIDSEILPDGTLTKESEGVELYSLNLTKISRNYFLFNQTLFKSGLLDLIDVHDEPKGKCRTYGVPTELVKKGVEKVFISEEEKRQLIETIRKDNRPDSSDPNPTPLVRYFLSLLKETKINTSDVDQLEIEVGSFRKLYPDVIRHQGGKYDLKITPTTGRLSSVYLYSPKVFRSLLRWKGTTPMVEGDVGGSHFHFLLEEMTDPRERKMMEKDLLSPDPYLSMCGNPVGVSREDLKKSSHIFKYGNRQTKFFFGTDYDWFQYHPYTEGLFYIHLSAKYPRFTEMMSKKVITHKKHRSQFSCDVMKRESKVMVDMVGEQCMKEKLVYLPIHDGFLTLPSQYDRICEIVTECFQMETGSTPKIKRK